MQQSPTSNPRELKALKIWILKKILKAFWRVFFFLKKGVFGVRAHGAICNSLASSPADTSSIDNPQLLRGCFHFPTHPALWMPSPELPPPKKQQRSSTPADFLRRGFRCSFPFSFPFVTLEAASPGNASSSGAATNDRISSCSLAVLHKRWEEAAKLSYSCLCVYVTNGKIHW